MASPSRIVDEMAARAATQRAERPQPRTIFISYARADHADEGRDPDCFVQKLYRALQAEGFIPWLDHHDMPSRGTPFPDELKLAIQQSERFLAVCGPAYPGAEWARAERDHAHELCLAITPVLIAGDYKDSLPDEDDLLPAIDMRAGFEQTWPDLLERLKEPAAVPGELIDPASTMPELNPDDLSRPAIFEQVKHALRADQTDPVTISGTRALTAMIAAGGIGKTTLAAQIATDCEVRRGFPDGVVWMRVGEHTRDPETLRITLGGYVGLPNEMLQGPNGQRNFEQRLKALDALIILDDVWAKEQVTACRVKGPNLRYLITTRLAALGNDLKLPKDNQIKMAYLTVDEGMALIARRLGLDPAADYPHKEVHRQIVERLQGHTQAIDIMAGTLTDPDGPGPDYAPELLRQLQQGDKTLFELLKRSVDAENREDNVLESLTISYRMLPGPDAGVDLQRCFRLLGAFAPGGTFDVVAAAAVWEIDDPERARRWLIDLARRSLVIRTADPDRYTLHTLIHAAARVLSQEHADEANAAAGRHAAYYQAKADYWTLERKHVSPLVPDIEQYRQAFRWARANALDRLLGFVISASQFLKLMSFYGDLREWLEVALPVAKETGDQLGEANTLKALGDLDRMEAKYGDARQNYTAALALFRAIPDRLGEANTLQALGDLSRLEGDYETAADFFQQAADLYHAIESLRDEAVMKAMFAQLRLDQGQSREAIRLMWEALQYFEAQQLPADIQVARNILRGFAQRIPDFPALWREVTGQPLPEWLRPVSQVSLTQEEAQRLADLLIAWVQTPDRGASEAYLREHAADLLTDAADAVMGMLIQGNPGRQKLEQHRALLRACREHGIEAAYEQIRAAVSQNPLMQGLRQFLRADSDEEARAVLLAQPELLLSDEAAGELEKLQGGDEASQASITQRKALWQQVRQEYGGG